MTAEHNFGKLGADYQSELMQVILTDKKFGATILEILEPHYFDAGSFRYIAQIMRDLYQKYEHVPTYDNVVLQLNKENKNDTSSKMHLDTIELIKTLKVSNLEQVKDTALDFCRQQVLKKELKVVQSIIDQGDFESYPKIEEIIKKALEVGTTSSDIVDPFDDISSVLQEDARTPIPTGIDGLDRELKGGLGKGELAVLLAPTGVGKSQPISEPILTPNGWKKMGDIKINDKIIGSDGKEQNVDGVYPQGIRPIYKIEFSDDTFVFCDEEHLWDVNTLNMRTQKTRKDNKTIYKPNLDYITLKTKNMINDLKKYNKFNYRLPTISPIEFIKRELKIDPYLLGILLGDGSLNTDNNSCVDTKDDEIFLNIEHLKLHTKFVEYTRGIRTIKRIRFKKSLNNFLKEYELLGKKSDNKFIPTNYKYSSVNDRLSILQGLMDTDGYVSKKGISQYTTISEQLAKDVKEIVLSLGGTVRWNEKLPKFKYLNEEKLGQLSYILTISFSNNIIPFKLSRKIERFKRRTKYVNQKFIKNIEFSHKEDSQCIKVSNLDELYVTRDYVLTHNTTLLTKFANAGYVDGHKILQIIFEDNVNSILRKHYTIWTKITPDKLKDDEKFVIETINNIKEQSSGLLKILKLPSDSVTISELKSRIRKLAMEGFVPDEILIDYVDCIVAERSTAGEEWKGEGNIMRHLESMSTEFDVAMWVATQGNRESISTEVVTTDLMGGSIKKAQIGHVVISVGKTLEQKENKLATLALLKSRIGNDGIVWQNCKFDNEFIIIDTDNQNTLFEHEETEEEKKSKRGPEVLRESKKREAEIMGDVKLTYTFDDAKAGIVNDKINTPISEIEGDLNKSTTVTLNEINKNKIEEKKNKIEEKKLKKLRKQAKIHQNG